MNNVKKYRRARRISQIKLSEMVGLKGRGYLAQVETGAAKLSWNLATKIADVLHVDVYDLLGDDILKIKPSDPESKGKAVASLTKAGNVSFTDSFISLIDSFIYLFETNEYKSLSDEMLYSSCYKIRENLDGFTENDFKDFYILVSQFIDGRGVKHRQALADVADDIKKEDR